MSESDVSDFSDLDQYEPLRDEDIVRLDDEVEVGSESDDDIDNQKQEFEFASALASATSATSAVCLAKSNLSVESHIS